jgi:hypothetical protein
MYDYLIERNADVNIGKFLEGDNALMAVIENFLPNDEMKKYY